MTKFAIGIDIGGTNTELGIVDTEGRVIKRGVISTVQYKSPEEFVLALRKKHLEFSISAATDDIVGVGIGAPNGNFYSGSIEFAPNLPWQGPIPLEKLISEAFELPAWLINDAKAAALGEMLYGGAKGMRDFIVITIGTGLGSGIMVNGEMLYGHDGFAGELGHTIVYPDGGRKCTCGRNGCLETYVSSRGIIETYYSHNPSVLKYDNISNVLIAERAVQGEEAAIKAFDDTGKILGLKLADAVAFSSPEAIFLFGGVTKAGDVLFSPVKKWMEFYLLEVYKNKVSILPSALPENSAAIMGAGALAFKNGNFI